MAPKFRGETGLVVVTGERGYAGFWDCWDALELPPAWQKMIYPSYDLLHGRNSAVAAMYAQDADWLLFMDDDHRFPRDLVQRLLRHRKEIVGPLVLTRYPPFRPTAHIGGKTVRWQGESGLIEIDQTGCAGLLVRRDVFDAVKLMEPIAHVQGGTAGEQEVWFRAGRIYPNRLAEDIDFCVRAKDAGFSVWCDLDTTMGHFREVCLEPVDGKPAVCVPPGYVMKGTFNWGYDLAETVPLSDEYGLPRGTMEVVA